MAHSIIVCQTFFLPCSIVTVSSIPESYTTVTTGIERGGSHSMHLTLAGVRNQYFSCFTKQAEMKNKRKGLPCHSKKITYSLSISL